MIKVELQNAATQFEVPEEAQFQCWAQAIESSQSNDQTVAIRIVDEEEMTELNCQYRQKVGPTNVLSFPSGLHEDVDIPFMGDVIICAPIVIKEAKEQGKQTLSHWAHMTVHGILHLQGYDHMNEAEAEQMESLEVQVMRTLGIENPYL